MPYKATLIADSGSTKTTWSLLTKGKQEIARTQGLSPYFLSIDEIKKVLLEELKPKLSLNAFIIEQIFFYGTGVAVAEKSKWVEEALSAVFSKSQIEINHDLTGAARALCQRQQGIACILGTGSGACYYDGRDVQQISPGLGFILGDEGSGAYLGKMLIKAYLYKTLDKALISAFDKTYALSKAEILQRVYEAPHPNRFLAGFSRFIGKHRNNPGMEEMIHKGIEDFIYAHIQRYQQYKQVPVHFVGGVAYAFRKYLLRVCESTGIRCGQILKEPIEGLIHYHQ